MHLVLDMASTTFSKSMTKSIKLLTNASRRDLNIIIAADFNITIVQNTRADPLFELVHAFEMVIGDDPSSNSFEQL